ncbi:MULTISPECIES: hypothetical protein [Halomonadaceae]|uniref:Uncharacterized protein n=1 Tax=Vreelandella sp. SM1641 TaxID=3126101 RepID=A0AAU7XHC6_9GAMM|nr:MULTISPECIES: hypothetical protein [Halomonas]AJY50242.1 hypothetical protein KO116_01757 [Halomonas sp. KO116]|tara:strand:+ start:30 stop:170 length:141 start_codon:yes stop_codon:yes gene_type:complete
MTQHNTNGSAKDVVDILTTDHQEMMALAGQLKAQMTHNGVEIRRIP